MTTRGCASRPGAVSSVRPWTRISVCSPVSTATARRFPLGANAAASERAATRQAGGVAVFGGEVVDRVVPAAADQQAPAVGGPREVADEPGAPRPQRLCGQGVLDRDGAVGGCPGDRARLARPPGRRDGGHVPARAHVVLAVAVDDPQRAAGAVGDLQAVGRPAREAHGRGEPEAPARRAVVRVDGRQRAAGRGDHEEAVR